MKSENNRKVLIENDDIRVERLAYLRNKVVTEMKGAVSSTRTKRTFTLHTGVMVRMQNLLAPIFKGQ
jgi:hypothetical protein